MPSNRLLAIITVLTCLGSVANAQSYSINQLREIERLIVARDCGGLRIFLAINSSLIEGPDPLAQELRKFVYGVDQGLIECLSLSEVDAATAAVTTRFVDDNPY